MQGFDLSAEAAATQTGGRRALPPRAFRRGAGRTLKLLAATASMAGFAACLAYAVLSFGGLKVAPVLSGSMSDLMPIGSLAIVKPESASRVHVGDVVMFSAPGYYGHYTHRVRSITGTADNRVFTTKGDMNSAPDPWRLRSLNGRGRVGKFVADVPYAGYLVEYAHDWRTKLCLLVALCLGGAVIVLRRIWRPAARAHA